MGRCTMVAAVLVIIAGTFTFIAALAEKTLSWPLLLMTIASFPILYSAWSAVDALFWSAAAAAAAAQSQSAAAMYGPLFACLYFASLVLGFFLQVCISACAARRETSARSIKWTSICALMTNNSAHSSSCSMSAGWP